MLSGVTVGVCWLTGEVICGTGVAGTVVVSSISMSSSVSISCTVESCVRLNPSLEAAKLFCRCIARWSICVMLRVASPFAALVEGRRPPGKPAWLETDERCAIWLDCCAWNSSKCCRSSCSESSFCPQQLYPDKKFASIFGRYEDEWSEGDLPKCIGDVPVIIMLFTHQPRSE